MNDKDNEELDKEVKKIVDEIGPTIKSFLDYLDSNGFELNDAGDIVEKNSKRLVFDLYNSKDEYNE